MRHRLLAACMLCWSLMCTAEHATTCDFRFPALQRFNSADLSQTQFVNKLKAGQTFVVTNLFEAGFAPGLREWSCAWLKESQDFKTVKVRREYAEPSADRTWVTLAQLEEAVSAKRMSAASPYYWAVREPATHDEAARDSDPESSTTWDSKRFAIVRKLMAYFSFFPRSMVDSMRDRPEVWISFPGAGAKAHMDSHTDYTMSLQLSGSKLWTIMPHIPKRSAAHATELFCDGCASDRGHWPMDGVHQTILSAGEAIFFPPGVIHETCAQNNTQETTRHSSGCGLSITYQFGTPYPWEYVRRHMKNILLTPDVEGLHGVIEEAALRRHALLLDLNGDSRVSSSEVQSAEKILQEVEQLKSKIPRGVRRVAQQGNLRSTLLKQWEQRMWSFEEHAIYIGTEAEL